MDRRTFIASAAAALVPSSSPPDRYSLLVRAGLVSRRDFTHKGVRVTELVVNWEVGDQPCRKLLWVKTPVEELVVDGQPNILAHTEYVFFPSPDYEKVNSRLERRARAAVRLAFEQHYHLPVG